MSAPVLRLFVTGHSAASLQALHNLDRLCHHWEAVYGEAPQVEIIDVVGNTAQAEEHQILVTPTLLKVAPGERRRIVGDLSDIRRVMLGLALAASPLP